MVARRDGAENLGVELDLVEGHAVVHAKIETVRHRAHLPPRARSGSSRQCYDPARQPRMTQQGHSGASSGGYFPLSG